MNSIGIDMKHSMRVVANTAHERSKADKPVDGTSEGESGSESTEAADFDSTATRLIEEHLSSQSEGSANTEPQTSDTVQLDEAAISSGPFLLENNQKIESGVAVADGHAARLPDDVLRFVELSNRGSRGNTETTDRAAAGQLLRGQDGSAISASEESSAKLTTELQSPVARQDHQKLAGIAVRGAEPEKSRIATDQPVGRGQQPHLPPGSELVTKGVQVTAIAVQSVGGQGIGQSQIKTGVSARLESSEATLRSRLGEALLQREGTVAKVVSSGDQSVTQAQHRAGQQSFENEIETSISVEMSSRDALPSNARAGVVNLVANALSKELAGQSDFRLAGSGDAGSVFSAQSTSSWNDKTTQNVDDSTHTAAPRAGGGQDRVFRRPTEDRLSPRKR